MAEVGIGKETVGVAAFGRASVEQRQAWASRARKFLEDWGFDPDGEDANVCEQLAFVFAEIAEQRQASVLEAEARAALSDFEDLNKLINDGSIGFPSPFQGQVLNLHPFNHRVQGLRDALGIESHAEREARVVAAREQQQARWALWTQQNAALPRGEFQPDGDVRDRDEGGLMPEPVSVCFWRAADGSLEVRAPVYPSLAFEYLLDDGRAAEGVVVGVLSAGGESARVRLVRVQYVGGPDAFEVRGEGETFERVLRAVGVASSGT